VFLSRKDPDNAEFTISGAILDARENWYGASDKARALTPDQFFCASGMAVAIANSMFSTIKTPTNPFKEATSFTTYHRNEFKNAGLLEDNSPLYYEIIIQSFSRYRLFTQLTAL